MKLSGCGHFLYRRVYRTLPCFIGGNSEVIEKYSNWMRWLTNSLLSEPKTRLTPTFFTNPQNNCNLLKTGKHRGVQSSDCPENGTEDSCPFHHHRGHLGISNIKMFLKTVLKEWTRRMKMNQTPLQCLLPVVSVLSCWNVTRHDLLHI